ncbi:hypothetical protein MKX08_009250 [Trichoderma sp. CBMAI-0020]|nr:hypothetical protein MKX08_009250 [Trichoderma sp. CBMAI-0020]
MPSISQYYNNNTPYKENPVALKNLTVDEYVSKYDELPPVSLLLILRRSEAEMGKERGKREGKERKERERRKRKERTKKKNGKKQEKQEKEKKKEKKNDSLGQLHLQSRITKTATFPRRK